MLWNVFQNIGVWFLPVEHTHDEDDQALSLASERLITRGSLTLDNLQKQQKQSFNGTAIVADLQHVGSRTG